MGILGNIFGLLNKLTPERKEQYDSELNNLVVKYNAALNSGKDTEAATYRKQITIVRRKLGYQDEKI